MRQLGLVALQKDACHIVTISLVKQSQVVYKMWPFVYEVSLFATNMKSQRIFGNLKHTEGTPIHVVLSTIQLSSTTC